MSIKSIVQITIIFNGFYLGNLNPIHDVGECVDEETNLPGRCLAEEDCPDLYTRPHHRAPCSYNASSVASVCCVDFFKNTNEVSKLVKRSTSDSKQDPKFGKLVSLNVKIQRISDIKCTEHYEKYAVHVERKVSEFEILKSEVAELRSRLKDLDTFTDGENGVEASVLLDVSNHGAHIDKLNANAANQTASIWWLQSDHSVVKKKQQDDQKVLAKHQAELDTIKKLLNVKTKLIDDSTLITTIPPLGVGGDNAYLSEFPHMAALGWQLHNGSIAFKCGGTLLSQSYVLTAGHCLSIPGDTTLAKAEPKIVRLGDLNILDEVVDGAYPSDIPIWRIVKHPNYNPPKKYYDVGLIELSYNTRFDKNIRPACLWTENTFGDYKIAYVTGWGTTVDGGKTNSPILQKVKVDLLTNEQCDPLLAEYRNRLWEGFAPHQLCAGVLAGGRDACQGDSGGPLQVRREQGNPQYVVVGVTSFGRHCARPNLPGVYIRISAILDWIESVVWPVDVALDATSIVKEAKKNIVRPVKNGITAS